jgi:hypothetical protein
MSAQHMTDRLYPHAQRFVVDEGSCLFVRTMMIGAAAVLSIAAQFEILVSRPMCDVPCPPAIL